MKSVRAGLTLVEMLVVLALLLILITLATAVVSRAQDQHKATSAAEHLQSWMVLARQRAMHDRLPTGLRLVPVSGSTTTTSPIKPKPGTGLARFQVSQLGGATSEAWSWNILPGSLLFIRDPAHMEVAIVQQVVAPNDVEATCERSHPSGIPIEVLAFARDLHLVQQPDDYHRGSGAAIEIRNEPSKSPTMTVADFGKSTRPGELLPGSLDSQVLPGDYLELFGGGGSHRILAVQSKDVLVMSLFTQPPLAGPLTTANYRIRRQPRLLPGEQPLQLPVNVVIDLSLSRRLPFRIVQASGLQGDVFVEILFAPGGGLMGSATSLGPIFWVRQVTADSPLEKEPILVSIQPGTGRVSAHPVSPGQDPYLLARETRSDGY